MARSDNFNRADNATTLGTPSDGGAGYSVISGGPWGISGNAAYNPGGGEHARAGTESGLADCKVRVRVTGTVAWAPEIWGRMSNAANGLMCHYHSNNWNLYKVVGGGFEAIHAAVPAPDPTGKVIGFDLDGDQVTFLVDEVAVVGPVTETHNQAATIHGFGAFISDAIRFEDFSVAPLTDPLASGTLSEADHDHDSVDLAWGGATGGVAPYSYQVQVAPDVAGSPGTFANVGSPTSTLTATSGGLSAETTYHHRVVVTDDASDTATSNVVETTTDPNSSPPVRPVRWFPGLSRRPTR